MAVKHTPTGVVHKGTKGGHTGCGFDTKDNSGHWVSSGQKITCDKNGCKNQLVLRCFIGRASNLNIQKLYHVNYKLYSAYHIDS